ncbi:MAG: DUF2961 domain-containing protein [Planctomycetota bacterium]
MAHKNKPFCFIFSFICFGLFVPSTAEALDRAQFNTAGYSLEHLPILPHHIKVIQFSSRNRTGENADAKHILYKNQKGHSVIFDALGPGCVKSMWSTLVNPELMLHFYFGDEADPRLSVNAVDFFSGKHPCFPAPMTSYDIAGLWRGKKRAGNCFVPIGFKNRLRIATSGPHVMFYHIIYESYVPGTYQPVDYLRKGGTINPASHIPESLKAACQQTRKYIKTDHVLTGSTQIKYTGAGFISSIALDMPADEEFIKTARLHIKFDKARFEQVAAPIGMLIANAHKPHQAKSLPVVVEKPSQGRFKAYIYFPMPFWEGFELRVHEVKDPSILKVEAAISHQPYPKENTGYFTTYFHQGNTTYTRDWLLGQGFGWGWYVGAVQSMRHYHYCEGDERIYIDNAASPAFNGTGSEDYYLCCFWPNAHFNLPFGGCVGGGTEVVRDGDPSIPSSYYRFHLDAPVPFYQRIDALIEHGSNSNTHSYYKSVSFFYIKDGPAFLQTDMIDVGNPASEKFHQYQCSQSEVVELSSQYEGDLDLVTVTDNGRVHQGGSISFKAALDKNNQGVRLRRRLDQKQARHIAKVYVDGKFVAKWYYPDHNQHKRWADCDFEIPQAFTKTKDSIEIKIEPIEITCSHDQTGKFSDFRYWVYCYKM